MRSPSGFVLPAIGFLFIAAGIFGQTVQAPKSWRQSAGPTTAPVQESLLSTLYPGAQFTWSPMLKIQATGGPAQVVYFPGFSIAPDAQGNLLGATGIEVGGAKRDFIASAKGLNESAAQKFPTILVVFRANPTGQILAYSKATLDSSDPLTKIETLHVQAGSYDPLTRRYPLARGVAPQTQSAPEAGWPRVEIHYVTYSVSPGSLTQIEWRGVFDPNSSGFLNRLPVGMVMKSVHGAEVYRIFRITRVNSSEIDITDGLSGTTKSYSCGEPCIVDGPTLLKQWSQ